MIVSRFVPRLDRRCGDAGGGPLPHADQGDHRRDADDHAQHRQGGAKPARPKAREREPDELEDPHATSRPSRMCTWRPADAATSASWVMRTIVLPARLSSRSSSSTSWPRGLVEVAGRLVGEDQGRVGDQRPGDRHALLLAAGQLRRLVVDAVAEAQPLERLASPGASAPHGRRPGRAAASRRSRARSSAAGGCTTGRRTRSSGSGCAPGRRRRGPRRACRRGGRCPRSAGRGSRRCSSSCSCPSPTARRWPGTRPRWTSRSTERSAGTVTWPMS